jgi:hypothetical protein
MTGLANAMDTKEFRRIVGDLAKRAGFTRTDSVWLLAGEESLIGLQLQRSNNASLYYLNIKVWLKRHIDGRAFDPGREAGHIFRREPPEYAPALDLNSEFDDSSRITQLEQLFDDFLLPLAKALSTRAGILNAAAAQPPQIYLLPSAKSMLEAQVGDGAA